MNYCSLDDAFGSPGCSGGEAGRAARKEEKRKAKRCKGPPLTFLDPSKDPDRQNCDRLPEVPALNSDTGMREHAPVTAMQGENEPFTDMDTGIEKTLQEQTKFSYITRTDNDPVGDAQRNQRPSPQSVMASGPGSFFGKDPSIDGFADYVPDAKNYLMEPSFTSAFGQNLLGKAGSGALPVPSVRDVWKPLIPSLASSMLPANLPGANTSFYETLPKPGGTYDKESHESLSRKIDGIMSRLDAMSKTASPEQTQTDILLFVSSGIFILFMMDLLVRKGSSLKFLKGL
jgi:hypothetical protein